MMPIVRRETAIGQGRVAQQPGFLLGWYSRYTLVVTEAASMRRTLRYLRISVTAFSLAACVLLIAFWVRSYYSVFRIGAPGRGIHILSWQGAVSVNPKVIRTGSRYLLQPSARIPYLPLVLLGITVGGLPWVHWYWGFSLRAMLIVTTLIAVLLAAIVYTSQ
jgi:hypothetical protein